jgi:predicted component of type VI protein secretion system
MSDREQQQSVSAARLNVKLTPETKPHQTAEALASTPGLISVVRTFPDEEDEELSRMYVVEVDANRSQDALENLQQNPAVEYAEHTAKRKLIK